MIGTMTSDPQTGGPARGGSAAVPLDRDQLLSELYQEHYRSLVRLAALLLGQREAAEDVVQEAFLELYRNTDRITKRSSADAYLRSIVLNLARSRMRRRLVARKHPPAPQPDVAGADAGIAVSEDSAELLAAMRALPRRQRECLALRFYEELTEDETGDTLEISRSSVKTHVRRGLATLTEKLEALR